MRTRTLSGTIPLFLAGMMVAVALLGAPAGAKGLIEATLGSDVELSGSTGGSSNIYLFITGPNLPSNGGRLDSPKSAVVTGSSGSFTKARVSGNSWSYTWSTSGIGLDSGSYTLFTVNMPVGKNDLAGSDADHTLTTIKLATSSVSVSAYGFVSVTTSPANASVFLDGDYKGTSTADIRNVEPGTHTVTVELDGYETATETISVDSGGTTNLVLTLTPLETETPAAAATSALPTQAATSAPAPALAALLAPGLAGALRRR